MKEKAAIISVIYEEPEWEETEKCIGKCDVPTFFVNRHGVGSLAKALNSGFRQWGQGFEFIWFITNVTFTDTCLARLLAVMEESGYAGMTPCFESDHLFCRPKPEMGNQFAPVPFVEFTAPMVRADVFKKFFLDENMPYWGHDLDWGHRVRQAGHQVGVFYGEELGHVYIRNNHGGHHITEKRARRRQATNGSTRRALVEKYGPEWRKTLCWA